jgi:hypothetical protein
MHLWGATRLLILRILAMLHVFGLLNTIDPPLLSRALPATAQVSRITVTFPKFIVIYLLPLPPLPDIH